MSAAHSASVGLELPIENRRTAGQSLASALDDYAGRDDVLVLALPRGGLPVAMEVAQRLQADLDLMLVRKLGVPGHEELAMGAIATGGVRVMNDDILRQLHLSEDAITEAVDAEQRELERRQQAYRGDRPPPQIENKVVILIDDGIATGATMRVAIAALRKQHPKQVIVAVPVAPLDTVEMLEQEADRVVCLQTPEPFMGIGRWYRDFHQVSDEEVKNLLEQAWSD